MAQSIPILAPNIQSLLSPCPGPIPEPLSKLLPVRFPLIIMRFSISELLLLSPTPVPMPKPANELLTVIFSFTIRRFPIGERPRPSPNRLPIIQSGESSRPRSGRWELTTWLEARILAIEDCWHDCHFHMFVPSETSGTSVVETRAYPPSKVLWYTNSPRQNETLTFERYTMRMFKTLEMAEASSILKRWGRRWCQGYLWPTVDILIQVWEIEITGHQSDGS